MNFRHVCEVTPWFERSLALGVHSAHTLAALPAPRVFKTHLVPRWVPRPARVVHVLRDREAVARSYHRLYQTHLGYGGEFGAFFERFVEGRVQYRSWYEHRAAWSEACAGHEVMRVRYEDMVRDLGSVVDSLASFLTIDLPPEVRADVLRMADRGFMKTHEEKFDPIVEDQISRGLSAGQFINERPQASALEPGQEARLEALDRASWRGPPPWALPDFLH